MKARYEEKHGYDLLRGEDSVKIAAEEVPRILADLLTIRASRMLDLVFGDSELLVNIRIISDELAFGEATARECVREMALLKRQIVKVLRPEK